MIPRCIAVLVESKLRRTQLWRLLLDQEDHGAEQFYGRSEIDNDEQIGDEKTRSNGENEMKSGAVAAVDEAPSPGAFSVNTRAHCFGDLEERTVGLSV
ncbi:hypothetical protein LXL04_021679 [Taraxacum kok-saghyz]